MPGLRLRCFSITSCEPRAREFCVPTPATISKVGSATLASKSIDCGGRWQPRSGRPDRSHARSGYSARRESQRLAFVLRRVSVILKENAARKRHVLTAAEDRLPAGPYSSIRSTSRGPAVFRFAAAKPAGARVEAAGRLGRCPLNRPLKNRSALRSASSSLPRIRSGASSAAYDSTPQSLLLLAALVSRLRLVSHAPHQVRGRLDLFDLFFGLRG